MGGDLTPLGTTDFSSYLIKAQAANPDVIIFLRPGRRHDQRLKQAVQFGLDKRFHLAGAQQELEALEGLPPEARIGTWVFEWYWNQPSVPHVAEFVAAIKKKTGQRADRAHLVRLSPPPGPARWPPTHAKSLDAVKMAKALQGFKLPPEVALMPDGAFYPRRPEPAHADLYVGNAQAKGSAAGGPVPCHRGRQGRRRRRHGRGDRLQDDLAAA